MITASRPTPRTHRLPNLGTMCNNPLNIRHSARNRWKGLHPTTPQVAGFCRFTAKVYGYRAALLLLRRYITHYGLRTPRQMLSRWAPPEENDNLQAAVAALTLNLPKAGIYTLIIKPFDG